MIPPSTSLEYINRVVFKNTEITKACLDMVYRGFVRLTGSELLFHALDKLLEYSRLGDEYAFGKELLLRLESIVEERPSSLASINVLKNIAQFYLDNGMSGIYEYILKLKAQYDEALWRAAEVASRRVSSGEKILTNSNSLAVRRLLKILRDQGKLIDIYVTESRPVNEGTLLAEYAESLGFTTYLIVDSATRFFMKNIDKVFMGAEAIAANGAVVSKVGSSLISLVAKESRKRVFIVAPSFKISYETIHGELFRVPEGGAELIIDFEKERNIPPGFNARVPLYDITPAEYIDAVATEYGLIAPQAIPLLIKLLYGSYPPSVSSISEILNGLKRKLGLR